MYVMDSGPLNGTAVVNLSYPVSLMNLSGEMQYIFHTIIDINLCLVNGINSMITEI